MPIETKNPTSNTSPDLAQGGVAVSSPTNTGHASTTVTGGGDEIKTCIWTGFAAAPGGPTFSVTLKASRSVSGSVGSGTNIFRGEYSLNSGSSWNTLFTHSSVGSPSGPTEASAALSISQNLTQVQVRDFLQATDDATLTGTISSIRIEVITQDNPVVVMM